MLEKTLSEEARDADSLAVARSVRRCQRKLGSAAGAMRSSILERLAALLETRCEELLAANREDLEQARAQRLAPALLGRLELSPAKIETLCEGVEQLARTRDPIGTVVRKTELDEGLVLRQVRSPIGVLLIIFESRPDAVIQIGSLALRTGNGVLLKGGSEARRSNRALYGCLRDAVASQVRPRGRRPPGRCRRPRDGAIPPPGGPVPAPRR